MISLTNLEEERHSLRLISPLLSSPEKVPSSTRTRKLQLVSLPATLDFAAPIPLTEDNSAGLDGLGQACTLGITLFNIQFTII